MDDKGVVVLKQNGRELWRADLRGLGGRRTVACDGRVARLQLVGARFPGTSVPADLEFVATRTSFGVGVRLCHSLGALYDGPIDVFLSGEWVGEKRNENARVAFEVGDGGRLVVDPRAVVRIDRRLRVSWSSKAAIEVGLDQDLLLPGRSLVLESVDPTVPTLFGDVPPARTRLALRELTGAFEMGDALTGLDHAAFELDSASPSALDVEVDGRSGALAWRIDLDESESNRLRIERASDPCDLGLARPSLCGGRRQGLRDTLLVAGLAESAHTGARVGEWEFEVAGDGARDLVVLRKIGDRVEEFLCEAPVVGANLAMRGALCEGVDLHADHVVDLGGIDPERTPRLVPSKGAADQRSPGSFTLRIVRPQDNLTLGVRFHNVELLEGAVRAKGPGASIVLTVPPQHVEELALWSDEWDVERDPDRKPAIADLEALVSELKGSVAPTEGPLESVPTRRRLTRLSKPSRLAFSLVPEDGAIELRLSSILKHCEGRPHRAPYAARTDRPAKPILQPPADDETAIDFPLDLTLSPDEKSRWRFARPVATDAGWTGIWRAVLRLDEGPVPGRGVWSPDFDDPSRTDWDQPLRIALPAGGSSIGVVPAGALVDLLGDPQGAKLTLPDTKEPGFSLLLQSGAQNSFALSDPRNRPIVLDGGAGQARVVVPAGATLRLVLGSDSWTATTHRRVKPRAFSRRPLRSDDRFQIVTRTTVDFEQNKSRPVQISAMELTPIGASVQLAGNWDEWRPDLAGIEPKASLASWEQSTRLGRDNRCKVVLFGYCFPTWQKATLTFLSERRLTPIYKGKIVSFFFSYLEKRAYVTMTERKVDYRARLGEYRDLPFVTIETPSSGWQSRPLDMAPRDIVASDGSGRRTDAIWVRHRGREDRVSCRFTDLADLPSDSDLSCIWVDARAFANEEVRKKVADSYGANKGARTSSFKGQEVTFAPQRGSETTRTRFPTAEIEFRTLWNDRTRRHELALAESNVRLRDAEGTLLPAQPGDEILELATGLLPRSRAAYVLTTERIRDAAKRVEGAYKDYEKRLEDLDAHFQTYRERVENAYVEAPARWRRASAKLEEELRKAAAGLPDGSEIADRFERMADVAEQDLVAEYRRVLSEVSGSVSQHRSRLIDRKAHVLAAAAEIAERVTRARRVVDLRLSDYATQRKSILDEIDRVQAALTSTANPIGGIWKVPAEKFASEVDQTIQALRRASNAIGVEVARLPEAAAAEATEWAAAVAKAAFDLAHSLENDVLTAFAQARTAGERAYQNLDELNVAVVRLLDRLGVPNGDRQSWTMAVADLEAHARNVLDHTPGAPGQEKHWSKRWFELSKALGLALCQLFERIFRLKSPDGTPSVAPEGVALATGWLAGRLVDALDQGFDEMLEIVRAAESRVGSAAVVGVLLAKPLDVLDQALLEVRKSAARLLHPRVSGPLQVLIDGWRSSTLGRLRSAAGGTLGEMRRTLVAERDYVRQNFQQQSGRVLEDYRAVQQRLADLLSGVEEGLDTLALLGARTQRMLLEAEVALRLVAYATVDPTAYENSATLVRREVADLLVLVESLYKDLEETTRRLEEQSLQEVKTLKLPEDVAQSIERVRNRIEASVRTLVADHRERLAELLRQLVPIWSVGAAANDLLTGAMQEAREAVEARGRELLREARSAVGAEFRAVAIQLNETYRQVGYDATQNARQVFADLTKSLPSKFDLSQVGGLVKPDLDINALSAAFGPLKGLADELSLESFDPKKLFGRAKILGGIALEDILGTLIGDSVPRVTRRQGSFGVEAKYELSTQSFQATDVFVPRSTKLDVSGTGRFDGGSRQWSLESHTILSDFALRLWAVEVGFERVEVHSRTGASPQVGVKIKDVTFTGPLEFVQKLATQFANFGDERDGFYIRLEGVQLRAGLAVAIPAITSGALSITDLSIRAEIVLSLLGDPVRTRFSLADPARPASVTVGILSGGIALGVLVSSDVARRIEALTGTIEYGGGLFVDIAGIVSGSVEAKAGIYYRLGLRDSAFSAYFRLEGRLSLLGLVNAQCLFMVGLTFQGGHLEGWAIYTIRVSVAFFKVQKSFEVRKTIAGSGSQGRAMALPGAVAPAPKAPRWAEMVSRQEFATYRSRRVPLEF